MRSLYYIAPKKRLNRFDALFEKADILPTPFPAENIRSLTAFIKSERAIAQQSCIVIDVADLTRWSSGHVLSAVQYLRSFAQVRPIIIGEPCEEVEDLFRCLRDTHHVNDVILASADAENVQETLEELLTTPQADDEALRGSEPTRQTPLSPGQKLAAARQTAGGEILLRKYTAERGKLIRVAVAGTMPRCGCTTQAFGLYHYLTAAGLYGAIEDRAGTLPLLSRYETVTETKHGGQSVRGVCFIEPGAATSAYNFVVTDMGVLTPDTVPEFCKADVSVLAGCAKPWELPAFAEAFKLLFGYPCRYMATVASFCTEADLQKLNRYLGEHYACAPWQPDIWHPANIGLYESLLSPALDQLCAGYTIEEEPEHGG